LEYGNQKATIGIGWFLDDLMMILFGCVDEVSTLLSPFSTSCI
jgi:hypothetical protein